MKEIRKLLNITKPVIGMIHVSALPGTPKQEKSPAEIIDLAAVEAETYKRAGIDAIAIENMHDVPYLKRNCGPEVVSMMSVIGREIKKASGIPCGMQILAGANKEALASAHAADMDFIRGEGFVFAHVGDEGIFESDAGELLRYRKHIGAENVKIFTDIKKKHSSHALTGDVDIVETAKAAEFFMSDGVIVTGNVTGEQPYLEEVQQVSGAVNIPLILGSGITSVNVENYIEHADGFIIGSYFKKNNDWQETVDEDKVEKFMEKYSSLKGR